ncbi:2-oxo acid dehydrogenase subunit E2 [Verrucomicrobiaceae bacterium N1E253]|uniref:Dihydrolipoamide acetyltransferase component of pyruvate dehydrogenase complex n=1 Tax=Oceaniferula marina TaxID=2748318 RepID=A0A851GIP3_9BACT|nr:2-oxo acid dehydrogenase subunit E2 [Oceaniferula marina]NWK57216.1 2-oxo acid dehydrogenase subunit E2 [Oceaniferula marina]
MPKVPILMPQLGESIAEATILRLNIAVGDQVEQDQDLIEVETNKAVMDVPSVCAGDVLEIYAVEGESYAVGTVLGVLQVTEEELDRTGEQCMDATEAQPLPKNGDSSEANEDATLHFKTDGGGYHEPKPVEPNVKGLPVPAGKGGAHYISPRMRARMMELGLRAADISAISGSGGGGRVTVEDLENFLEYIETWPHTKASPMRLAVADAMRRSWSRPLATVARPLVMDKILDHRRGQDPKPGPALYILRALALALAENPTTAGYLIGESVVHPRSFDIGVAVQVEDGVLVPIIRNADSKRLKDLVEEYHEMVSLARARKLPEEATQHGIATVTNFGTFGLTWGTPIPLPNETLILGLSAGVKRPVWSEQAGAFIPVTEAEIDLTFDHRVVDGGGAGMLLNRISELLQKPEDL